MSRRLDWDRERRQRPVRESGPAPFEDFSDAATAPKDSNRLTAHQARKQRRRQLKKAKKLEAIRAERRSNVAKAKGVRRITKLQEKASQLGLDLFADTTAPSNPWVLLDGDGVEVARLETLRKVAAFLNERNQS